MFEEKLKERGVTFARELRISVIGNILDFVVENKVIIEFKAVPFLTREHYDQVKRYLYQSNFKLGLLVNFREARIKPKRVLNINNLKEPQN